MLSQAHGLQPDSTSLGGPAPGHPHSRGGSSGLPVEDPSCIECEHSDLWLRARPSPQGPTKEWWFSMDTEWQLVTGLIWSTCLDKNIYCCAPCWRSDWIALSVAVTSLLECLLPSLSFSCLILLLVCRAQTIKATLKLNIKAMMCLASASRGAA